MGVEPTRTGCKRGVVGVASLQSTSELCKELRVLGWDNVLQCNSFIELVGSTSHVGRVKADTQIPEGGHVLFQVLGHLLNGPSEY